MLSPNRDTNVPKVKTLTRWLNDPSTTLSFCQATDNLLQGTVCVFFHPPPAPRQDITVLL